MPLAFLFIVGYCCYKTRARYFFRWLCYCAGFFWALFKLGSTPFTYWIQYCNLQQHIKLLTSSISEVGGWICLGSMLLFTQSCFLLNYISVISSRFIHKVVQKCQCYYTLLVQRVPLVTVTSVVSLQTKQLCIHQYVIKLL